MILELVLTLMTLAFVVFQIIHARIIIKKVKFLHDKQEYWHYQNSGRPAPAGIKEEGK